MNICYEFDTIYAQATPFGIGAVAVIRISGDKSWDIAREIFSKKNISEGKIEYGWIIENNNKIDEVIVLPFKAPKSFTGEDVIEIQCHGGINIVKKILDLISTKGARMAEKAEFTKRAFMNGRIDLTKAEAIDDIIHAKTTRFACKSALNLSGVLAIGIEDIKNDLFKLLATINAAIDFPEDVPEPEYETLEKEILKIKLKIEKILSGAKSSNILRDGAKIAIIGKPNAGKSSLFNKLLNLERAIVTDIAGTTRDILTETIAVNGIPLTFIDTAGIRKEKDINPVEAIGIEYSIRSIDEADVILFLFDSNTDFGDDDEKVFSLIKDKKYIKVGTKIDLQKDTQKTQPDTIYISVLQDETIETLKNAIVEKILNGDFNETDYITNQRQQSCAQRALTALNEALNGVYEHQLQDLISIDIKSALLCVNEISGEVITDDILNDIFENFCIGK